MEVHLTIDFFDDMVCGQGAWSEAALREMVREVARRGITAIHWIDHGRLDGGYWDTGTYLDKGGVSQRLAKTVPDPLGVVCDEAHKIGVRVIAVIKPWDFAFRIIWNPASPDEDFSSVRLSGIGGENSPAKFIRENPHVRARLHPSLIPDPAEAKLPIQTMRIWHGTAEMPPAGDVTLYISYDNISYEPYQGPLRVERAIRRRKPPLFAPAPEQKFDAEGDFACIELADMQIDAPFVCVQFDGPTGIRNNLAAMIEVLGPQSQQLAFTYGLVPKRGHGDASWKNVGVYFEAINGSPITRTHAGPSESAGRFTVDFDELKLLAIGRGRNEYLFSPIEFAYPEVQQGLLKIIDEALESGVDGIDIRQSTHCESLDWENYGFNEPMLKAFREEFGVDPVTQPFDRAKWHDLRGRFLDQFLQQASKRARENGATFAVHLDRLMNLPNDGKPTWLNMGWHWRDWLTSGMVDAVTFKTGDRDETFYREALQICRDHNLQTIFTRKPTQAHQYDDFARYFAVAKADGFDAVNMYELVVLAILQPDGKLKFNDERLWQLVRQHAGTKQL